MTASQLNRFAANTALWLIGFLLVAPFTFNTLLLLFDQTIPFFAFHWTALTIGLAAIGLLPWAADSKHGIRIPYSVVPLLGLIGICLYQAFTLDIYYSAPYVTYITYMIWAIALFVLGATLHQKLGPDKLIQTIAWFSLIGALLAALTGLIQLAGVPEFLQPWIISFNRTYPIGNVRHPNFFACHIMLGLLALTYLFGMRKISLRWFLPCAILLTTVIAFSPSRTLYLYFLLVIGWTTWLEWQTRDITTKRYFLAMSFSFALFLLLQWGVLPILEQLTSLQLQNAATRLQAFQDDGQLFSRIDAWQATWQMFLKHPLLGVGIGNYSWFHFLLIDHSTHGPFGHPHNLPLFYLGTTGIIGATLLLLYLIVIANRLRVVRHNHAYWFLTVFLLVIFIFSMLEFPLWLPAFLGVTAFLCGVLDPKAGWQLNPPALPRKLAHVLLVTVCMLLLLDTLGDYRNLTKVASGRLSPETATSFAINGAKNPWLRPYAERFFLSSINLHDKERASKLLSLNSRQLHWQPTYATLLKQTVLLSAIGKTDESLQMFSQATLRYPKLKRGMRNFCEKNSAPELAALCSASEN